MPQLTYALEQSLGYEGNLADTRDIRVDARRNDAAASAELPFGRFVTKSAATDHLGMKLPAASEVLLGILVHSHSNEKTVTGLPNLEFGDVLSQGRVLVKVENAVAPGDIVLCRIDSGGNGAGSCRGGAAVAASLTAIPQARFLTAAAINGLAVVELNMPAVPTLA